jgi:hypothetical protein
MKKDKKTTAKNIAMVLKASRYLFSGLPTWVCNGKIFSG